MILSIIGSVVHFLVNAYILVLFVRMILDWVLALSPTWRPSGIVASLFDAIYQLTEPPLRWPDPRPHPPAGGAAVKVVAGVYSSRSARTDLF